MQDALAVDVLERLPQKKKLAPTLQIYSVRFTRWSKKEQLKFWWFKIFLVMNRNNNISSHSSESKSQTGMLINYSYDN